MGARGPKPKSPALKMLAGNPGKRPLKPGAQRGARWAAGVPAVPKHLSKAAKVVWKRTVKELQSAGVLAMVDREIIAAFSVAVADLEALSARIDADGLMLEVEALDRNGRPTGAKVLKAHPLLKWRQDLLNKVRQLAAEIGVTPAARSKVSGPPEDEAEKPVNRVREIAARVQAAREANPAAPGSPG